VHLADMDDLPRLFHDQVAARNMVRAVMDEERSWRGELLLDAGGGGVVPLAIRADVIPRLDGVGALGRIVLVTNMTEGREADAARDRVQRAIRDAQRPLQQSQVPFAESADFHHLLEAVLTHANLAVMEVADDADSTLVVPTLDDLEASTKRLADLTMQMSAYAAGNELDG
jgi:chemotaxis family two-component system sensor kinase Cph1